MHTVQLLGLAVVNQNMANVLSELKSHISHSNAPWRIATPNPEQIMLSRQDDEFLGNLKQMDWLMPDGVGLIWASRVLNKPDEQIVERITGLDLVPKLIEMARENNRPVLIVGGRDYQDKQIYLRHVEETKKDIDSSNEKFGQSSDQAEALVLIRPTESLKDEVPDKGKIQKEFGVWWSQGYEDVGAPTREEHKWLEELISRLEPAVIFVALGAPHQEKWLVSRRALLSAHHVRIGVTVGGAFDVLTGQLSRAPQSWQNLGLEWLWRLIQEPHRWRRQLALIKFVGLVLRTKFTLP